MARQGLVVVGILLAVTVVQMRPSASERRPNTAVSESTFESATPLVSLPSVVQPYTYYIVTSAAERDIQIQAGVPLLGERSWVLVYDASLLPAKQLELETEGFNVKTPGAETP